MTTYGLLKEHSKVNLRDWIYQLIGQGMLLQQGTDYPLLKLNPLSWEVMRASVGAPGANGAAKGEKPGKSKADETSWEGVDRDLFEILRQKRRALAIERGVPPYVIFSDTTLRDLARVRPSTLEKMRYIYGIGDNKLRDFGQLFLALILEYAEEQQVTLDEKIAPPRQPEHTRTNEFKMTPRHERLF